MVLLRLAMNADALFTETPPMHAMNREKSKPSNRRTKGQLQPADLGCRERRSEIMSEIKVEAPEVCACRAEAQSEFDHGTNLHPGKAGIRRAAAFTMAQR